MLISKNKLPRLLSKHLITKSQVEVLKEIAATQNNGLELTEGQKMRVASSLCKNSFVSSFIVGSRLKYKVTTKGKQTLNEIGDLFE